MSHVVRSPQAYPEPGFGDTDSLSFAGSEAGDFNSLLDCNQRAFKAAIAKKKEYGACNKSAASR